MHFVFYPKHEYGCPQVGHCPHLGGASLGTLVLAADEQTEWNDALWRQIDALREEAAAKSDTIRLQAGIGSGPRKSTRRSSWRPLRAVRIAAR